MSSEREFVRHASPIGDASLAGRTFVGRLRQIAIVSGTPQERFIDIQGGIDLYDESSDDFSKPFMTIGGVSLPMGPIGTHWFSSGMPLSQMPCFVTFDKSGRFSVESIEFNGIYHAWFRRIPADVGTGGEPSWEMVTAEGSGFVMVLPGPCPFIPPVATTPVDLGFPVPCPPGMSSWEPVFATVAGEYVFGSSASLYTNWRAEYQACDGADPDNDSDGIRSPWNRLSKNCCKDDDETLGSGDPDDPGGGEPCDNGLSCAIMTRRCFNPLGGTQFVEWCLIPNQMHCENANNDGCFCSGTELVGGGVVPAANSVPIGTVLFVKCQPTSQQAILRCDRPLFGGTFCV